MWRGAHGRVAAIVVLGGSLLGCAAPRPVAEVDRGGTNAPLSCGYRPQPSREWIIQAIGELARKTCAASAGSAMRQGEIHVVVRSHSRSDDNRDFVEVETELRPDLIEDDRRCVEMAARAALRDIEEASGSRASEWASYVVTTDVTVDVALGGPQDRPPPPARQLIDTDDPR